MSTAIVKYLFVTVLPLLHVIINFAKFNRINYSNNS